MGTRRERLERKAEKRREWAGSAARKSDAAFNKARAIADNIPLGQPILIGHHSEKHARRDAEKIQAGMSKGCELDAKAKDHESKAAGLEDQLASAVFSDDADAIEQLRERIAGREFEAARRKQINAAWRRAKTLEEKAVWSDKLDPPLTKEERADIMSTSRAFGNAYRGIPYPPYSLSNLSANIRRDRQRIAEIERRQSFEKKAEEAGGILIGRDIANNWCSVRFSEKPARAILEELKAAGFGWGGGCWCGHLDKLPASVVDLEAQAKGGAS